jgi:exodeoxyribonuclease V alpha subunit
MTTDTITGTVSRVIFSNEETGYAVLDLTVEGRFDADVTVVGVLPPVKPGERLHLEGTWTTHPKYGEQFKAERCEQLLPATITGIREYLASSLIRGIGPVTAERIVQRFGIATIRVLDEEPERLQEVTGIGPKTTQSIAESWNEHQSIRRVMMFLQGHSVSTGLAVKIHQVYGDNAMWIVQEDPYRLVRDIRGVGFKTADKIARDLGLPSDAAARVQAGVVHILREQVQAGHVYTPREQLVTRASRLLGVPPDLVEIAIEDLWDGEVIHCETLTFPTDEGEEDAVYLTPFYYGEVGVTNRLQALAESPTALPFRSFSTAEWEGLMGRATRFDGIELSPQQRQAIYTMLTSKITVLTGGPGTGKTQTVRTIIGVLEDMDLRYTLCAPTGRAAKRLAETTGRKAQTIHRLLQYSNDGFLRNEENPLEIDFLIVDEASMLDLLLTNHLLKAVDPSTHVLFVGDVDQLPSVGAGDVLRDVIASNQTAVVRLTTIFRQAENSGIVVNAHRVNNGEMPRLKGFFDFYFFSKEDPQQAADLLVDIVQRRIPSKFGLDPVDQVQVLAPMYRGVFGVASLNARLQEALNPHSVFRAEQQIGGRLFRVGDKVMQVQNNYGKNVFNGDIGRLTRIDLEKREVVVKIDDRPVTYRWDEIDELMHAFAVTIHKAQGSEYDAVVVALHTQHYRMLQRNLLYTAITRAKGLVVLVGTRRAVGIAVNNDKVRKRYSGLGARLERTL